MHRVTLQCTAGGSSKEYTLLLVETRVKERWDLFAEYGKIGGTQRRETKCDGVDLATAAVQFDKLQREKRGKGYVIVYDSDVETARANKRQAEGLFDEQLADAQAKVETHQVVQELERRDNALDLPKDDFHSFMPVKTNNGAYDPDDLPKATDPRLVIEQKFDGSFYMARFIETGCDDDRFSPVTFTSRRISAKDDLPIEKGANLPHINVGPSELVKTLLMGEVIMASGQFTDSSGIMNSSPAKALAKQAEHGFLTYMVFDCLWYKGQDIRSEPFLRRREFAMRAVAIWKGFLETNDSAARPMLASHVELSPFLVGPAFDAFVGIVQRGGEGIMLKETTASYGAGVFKCKKFFDVSVFVSGFVPGKGKYDGQIGAIKFSVKKNGTPVEVGQCSGMEDAVRKEISKDFTTVYMRKVLDVRCQPPDNPEKFKAGEDRLRHPRFIRFRDDLAAKQCTEEKLISDFKGAKAKK